MSGMVKELSAILVERIIILVCESFSVMNEDDLIMKSCSSADICECNWWIFQNIGSNS